MRDFNRSHWIEVERKKYDAWSIRTGLLCCLPSNVPLIDKQRLKKCPILGPLTLHTCTVPRATTVVVCWLLPPEQSQLVSHHACRRRHARDTMIIGAWRGAAKQISFVGSVPSSMGTRLLTHYNSGEAWVSTTLDRHSLGQNAKYPSLHSLSSSFRFSQLASADDLSVLATCRSDTSATLSSDVKGSVVHKSTREWLIWLIEADKSYRAYFSNVTFMHF